MVVFIKRYRSHLFYYTYILVNPILGEFEINSEGNDSWKLRNELLSREVFDIDTLVEEKVFVE